MSELSIGTQIGPYHIRDHVAAGGMGEIYRAEQTEPVKREVALKVIKPGLDTTTVIARFEAERQALALMQHPGIAQVFDAGTTEQGRPYFVMELIEGKPLNAFCQTHELPLESRLRLIMAICQAVQHAHQKGVIHRDLKPSNILISGQPSAPQPKIIDFGIAKATSGEHLTDRTLVTRFNQVLGTPAYMSPEQLDITGMDLDTRTDVYALGAILYELVTDKLPFDQDRLDQASQTELEQILWEEEPIRPSKRLDRADARFKDLQGDLDWIVLKALHKDRNQRYESASGLADDIQRFLDHVPVLATPPTKVYHARKFIRRHRIGIAFAATTALLLVAGAALSLWQAIEARQARATAEIEAASSKAMIDFLTEDLLRMGDPMHESDRDLPMSTVVQRARERLEDRFHDQPIVRAELLDVLARSMGGLGDYEAALAMHRESLAIRQSLSDGVTSTQIRLSYRIAYNLVNLGRFDEARAILEPLIELVKKTMPPKHDLLLEGYSSLARAYTYLGRYEESEALSRFAYEVFESEGRLDDRRAPGYLLAIGSNYIAQGRPGEAQPYFERHLKAVRAQHARNTPYMFTSLHNLGASLMNQGKIRESLPYLEEALTIQRDIHDERHPQLLKFIHEISGAYFELGQIDKALESVQEAWKKREERFGNDHELTLESFHRFLEMSVHGKRSDGIEVLAEELLHRAHRTLGDSHGFTNDAFQFLAHDPQYRERALDFLTNETPWPTDETTLLVGQDSVWKTNDRGEALADSWKHLAFDDSDWESGQGPIGYGEADIAHTVSFGPDKDHKHATVYLRHAFRHEGDTPKRLRIRVRRDDGVAIYLNGTEILRHHLPTPSTHTTFATEEVGKIEEQLYYVQEIAPDLLAEENLLAAEVHQCNGGSSDLVFDAVLECTDSP